MPNRSSHDAEEEHIGSLEGGTSSLMEELLPDGFVIDCFAYTRVRQWPEGVAIYQGAGYLIVHPSRLGPGVFEATNTDSWNKARCRAWYWRRQVRTGGLRPEPARQVWLNDGCGGRVRLFAE